MGVFCSFTLQDAYARTTRKSWEGTATTISQAETDAAALLTDIAACSLCGAVKRTLSVEAVLSEAVESGANVDAGGTVHCRLNNGKLYALKIPAIDPGLVNPDGSIDIEAAAITGLVANFESGGAYRVSEGNYITSIEYGELDR